MSKRYSESLIQVLNNGFGSKEDIVNASFVGTKESDTPPPSSVGTFHEGCLADFVEIENRNNYSPVISRWGECLVKPLIFG
jgi:hypothetical protein